MKLSFDLPVIQINKKEELSTLRERFEFCLIETYNTYDLFSSKTQILESVKACVEEELNDVSKSEIEEIWNLYIARNNKIIEILEELKEESVYGGNRFRTQAYGKAISAIKNVRVPIISGSQAQKLKGVGSKIAKKIDEILETGELRSLVQKPDEVRKRIDVLREFGAIWGVGPKTAVRLYDAGYRNIDDIPDKALNSKQKIGLTYYKNLQERIPRKQITLFEKDVRKILNELGNLKMCICGSYRRGLPDSGDIDLLLAYEGSRVPQNYFKRILKVLHEKGILIEDLSQGAEIYSGIMKTRDGIARRIDIHFVPKREWGSQTLYFTGSKEFNIDLRNLAIRQNRKLSDKGLFDEKGNRLPLSTEKEILEALGLPYIKPQNRTDLSKWS